MRRNRTASHTAGSARAGMSRVGAGFGDVIAGDRDSVEVAHVVFDEELLDVGHHAHREFGRENAGVLRLVFLENIGLHGGARTGQRLFLG